MVQSQPAGKGFTDCITLDGVLSTDLASPRHGAWQARVTEPGLAKPFFHRNIVASLGPGGLILRNYSRGRAL